MMALPSQELNAPWVRRAIEATSNDLMANRKAVVECSPLYHATSALSVYLDRITAIPPNIAQGAPKTHTISSSKELQTADAALSRPVVEQPETVPAEEAYSEAVKTPVMESSGVDSNGAPKALTGPVTTVPDVPAQEETAPLQIPGEATAEPKPASEPIPGEPMPPGSDSGGTGTIVQPEAKAGSSETTPGSAVEASEPGPGAPAQLSDKTAANSAASADKIRVFGPRPAPATHIAPKSNPPADMIRVDVSQAVPDAGLAPELQITASEKAAPGIPYGPSTPVPAVPLPGELLFTLPEDQLVPTPVADSSSSQPLVAIPSPELVVSTDPPQVTAKIKKGNPDLLPLETQTIPLRSAGSSSVLPNDEDIPPAEVPAEKKTERWKATPPERRKVIVVEEKNPGV